MLSKTEEPHECGPNPGRGYLKVSIDPEIRTRRLLLRKLQESDAPIVRKVYDEDFETDEHALSFIRWVNNRTDTCVNYLVILAQSDEVIGRMYFHSKAELNGEVEIGYGMQEEYRNFGYATEAARAVIPVAFEVSGRDVLVAIVKPDNIPSRRVVEKLGFKKHGVRRVEDEKGKICDFDYFQLSRPKSGILT